MFTEIFSIDLRVVTGVCAVVQTHQTGPLKWCTLVYAGYTSIPAAYVIVVIKRSEVCTVLMEGRAGDMLSSRHMFSSLLLILLVHTTILREVCFGGRQMEKVIILLLQGGA